MVLLPFVAFCRRLLLSGCNRFAPKDLLWIGQRRGQE
jgi:hypothetical protein